MNGNFGRIFMIGSTSSSTTTSSSTQQSSNSCQQQQQQQKQQQQHTPSTKATSTEGRHYSSLLSGITKIFSRNFKSNVQAESSTTTTTTTAATKTTRTEMFTALPSNGMDYNNMENIQNNNRFIMGLKNIVNGLISPAMNFDLYSKDLNLRQKFGNNANCNNLSGTGGGIKSGEVILPTTTTTATTTTTVTTATGTIPITSTRSHTDEILKTAILSLGCSSNNNNNSSSNQSHHPFPVGSNSMEDIIEKQVIAVHCSEDFPELPLLHSPDNRGIVVDNIWNPKSKCSFNERNVNATTKNCVIDNNVITMSAISTLSSTDMVPVKITKDMNCNQINKKSTEQQQQQQDLECDSIEDDFVMFATTTGSDSPSKCLSSKLKGVAHHFMSAGGLCNRLRQREISECSDDSFVICFTEDAPEGILEVLSDDDIDDDDDDDYDDDDTDTDTDCDSYTGMISEDDDDDGDDHADGVKANSLRKINKVVSSIQDTDETDGIPHYMQKTENCFLSSSEEASQPDSGFDEQQKQTKKVRFNLKPEVHVMHAWDYAYRASRKGHWEMCARDRERFQRRIEHLAEILNPILYDKHRKRIYENRFCDNKTNIEYYQQQ